MCLAVPGRVEEVWDADGTRMARVDFGGVHKEVCLAYVPEVEVGDYTIVHVGVALTRLDEAAARQTLALFDEVVPGDVVSGDLGSGDVGSGDVEAGDVVAADVVPEDGA
ncbi:MAG: HypC/HybG/HupF family hydrogenase formation chaperone [Acidimicrobiales bacterium]